MPDLIALTNLDEDQFWDTYLPQENHEQSNIWTFSETREIPITRVWTLVEGETGAIYAQPGYHIVNTIGYAVTKKPWTTTLIEGLWCEALEEVNPHDGSNHSD